MKEILIIAGLSAAGKTVASAEIMERDGRFTTIRSVTTRPPRGDAHDGEYFYLTEAELISMWERGELCEYMSYAGYMYGTPRSELDRAHREGKIPLLVLDLKGVFAFSALSEYNSCMIYLYEDILTVEERLRLRYAPSEGGDGLLRFNSRVAMNIADAKSLPDVAQSFYAFVKNGASPAQTADFVLSAFSRFLAGESADVAGNLAAAESLAEQARAAEKC